MRGVAVQWLETSEVPVREHTGRQREESALPPPGWHSRSGEGKGSSPGRRSEPNRALRTLREAEGDLRSRDQQVQVLRERTHRLQASLEAEKRARVEMEAARECGCELRSACPLTP
jgi:hypothetical protein